MYFVRVVLHFKRVRQLYVHFFILILFTDILIFSRFSVM